jgi:metal-responsive CopG/Arc/MetJ family transcriptional regulator
MFSRIIGINSPMRTSLSIDDDLIHLIQAARDLSGVRDKSALIREGLKALIERESARHLARLGGSEPRLQLIRRRDSKIDA